MTISGSFPTFCSTISIFPGSGIGSGSSHAAGSMSDGSGSWFSQHSGLNSPSGH